MQDNFGIFHHKSGRSSKVCTLGTKPQSIDESYQHSLDEWVLLTDYAFFSYVPSHHFTMTVSAVALADLWKPSGVSTDISVDPALRGINSVIPLYDPALIVR